MSLSIKRESWKYIRNVPKKPKCSWTSKDSLNSPKSPTYKLRSGVKNKLWLERMDKLRSCNRRLNSCKGKIMRKAPCWCRNSETLKLKKTGSLLMRKETSKANFRLSEQKKNKPRDNFKGNWTDSERRQTETICKSID